MFNLKFKMLIAWSAPILIVYATLIGCGTTSSFTGPHIVCVDRLINAAIDRGEIPGAVLLVGQGDDVLYRKAYGWRTLMPLKEPMMVDTLFDLASLTKPVACATSIMLLYQRGLLRPCDPVAKYLSRFGVNGKQGVTIEQILLHRAGLVPDNPLADYFDGPAKAMANICALETTYEPGSAFCYSDVGYIVLGELVRVIDGRSLDQFAHEEIFAPLGMKDTCFNPPASWRLRCAPTEQRDGRWMRGEVHDPRAHALGGVAGHAGLFSTADDLARWCRMILNGGELSGNRVLSKPTVAEMIQSRYLPSGDECRAYGFDVDTQYSSARGEVFARGTTVGHTGFTGTMFWLDPKNNGYVILLTHRVHPNGQGKIVDLRRRVATLAARLIVAPSR